MLGSIGRVGDWVDFDTARNGDSESAATVGVNFRPTEDTVFKLDYAWMWTSAPGSTTWSLPSNRLFLSLASYF